MRRRRCRAPSTRSTPSSSSPVRPGQPSACPCQRRRGMLAWLATRAACSPAGWHLPCLPLSNNSPLPHTNAACPCRDAARHPARRPGALWQPGGRPGAGRAGGGFRHDAVRRGGAAGGGAESGCGGCGGCGRRAGVRRRRRGTCCFRCRSAAFPPAPRACLFCCQRDRLICLCGRLLTRCPLSAGSALGGGPRQAGQQQLSEQRIQHQMGAKAEGQRSVRCGGGPWARRVRSSGFGGWVGGVRL